jgi:thioesterase domain-containing protein
MNFEAGHSKHFPISDVLLRDHIALAADYAPPVGDAEAAIAGIWALALKLDRVGRHDDFFELGGDSLAATIIANEIAGFFKAEFAPARIIDNSTVESQAKLVAGFPEKSETPQLASCLVGNHVSGKRPPLFLIHGARGFTFFNKDFLEVLGHDQPVYLFHVPGLDGQGGVFTNVKKLAAIYVSAMQSVQPKGPYTISAICTGAFVGLEMCLRLTEQGHEVKNLIIIDPPPMPRKIAHFYPAFSTRRNQWFGIFPVIAKRLLNRLRNFMQGQRFVLSAELPKWHSNPRKARKWQRKAMSVIERRRIEGEFPAEELRYKPQDMIDASLALSLAFVNYVPEKPYPGHAHMLVNNVYGWATTRDDLFWKKHLGSFDYEVVPGDHKDLFGKQIRIVADFVKRIIDA